MTLPKRIFLTGFSGTGKTVVAPVVADQLGWQVIDTDPAIEDAAGKRILDIFRDEGEEHFRDLESEAIQKACRQDHVVVATGGGAVLRPENRRSMAEGALVVCLEARPETILQRLTGRSPSGPAGPSPLDRPLLATADPLARIRQLKSERAHLYALSDWTVHTDALSPEEAAAEVLRAFQEVSPQALADPR